MPTRVLPSLHDMQKTMLILRLQTLVLAHQLALSNAVNNSRVEQIVSVFRYLFIQAELNL